MPELREQHGLRVAAAAAVRPSRSLPVGGEPIEVRVRESARARHMRLVVAPGEPLEVVVPRRTRDREVDRLLEEKRRWIERQVAAMREVAARPRLGLDDGIWLAGEQLEVERVGGTRAVARLEDGRPAGESVDNGRPSAGPLVIAGPPHAAPAAVGRWYRREARRRITAAAAREARRLGLTYRSIGIRDQRTRWGSCSGRGALSFSWRLVVAPPEVLDYIVVHEVCHLRELNHSRRFWRLLDSARPGWRAEAGWLREHGWELHGYRPELGAATNRV